MTTWRRAITSRLVPARCGVRRLLGLKCRDSALRAGVPCRKNDTMATRFGGSIRCCEISRDVIWYSKLSGPRRLDRPSFVSACGYIRKPTAPKEQATQHRVRSYMPSNSSPATRFSRVRASFTNGSSNGWFLRNNLPNVSWIDRNPAVTVDVNFGATVLFFRDVLHRRTQAFVS